MAFSKVEKWSNRLDAIEKDITKYHRWATGEIVLVYPERMDSVRFAVTKQMIQSEDRDLCQC